ncbi:MAG: hypothetical protein R3E77_15405 [Steroidobacteraceae bacterium]
MSQRRALSRVGATVGACLAAALIVGCGGVEIAPAVALPRALVNPIEARVGLLVQPDMRNFVHKESRWGVPWSIELGPGHLAMVRALFGAEFKDVAEFSTLEEAHAASGLRAIFEPRIEQFSFATAKDTGGGYYAVTIRYRFNVLTPDGAAVDSLTLTGYGNSAAKGVSSGNPLILASQRAMRDAVAKFLVQFPEMTLAAQLRDGAPLLASATGARANRIEAVPIIDTAPATGVVSPPASLPEPVPPAAEPAPVPPPQERLAGR